MRRLCDEPRAARGSVLWQTPAPHSLQATPDIFDAEDAEVLKMNVQDIERAIMMLGKCPDDVMRASILALKFNRRMDAVQSWIKDGTLSLSTRLGQFHAQKLAAMYEFAEAAIKRCGQRYKLEAPRAASAAGSEPRAPSRDSPARQSLQRAQPASASAHGVGHGQRQGWV